jgi:hypothetical protein
MAGVSVMATAPPPKGSTVSPGFGQRGVQQDQAASAGER